MGMRARVCSCVLHLLISLEYFEANNILVALFSFTFSLFIKLRISPSLFLVNKF